MNKCLCEKRLCLVGGFCANPLCASSVRPRGLGMAAPRCCPPWLCAAELSESWEANSLEELLKDELNPAAQAQQSSQLLEMASAGAL